MLNWAGLLALIICIELFCWMPPGWLKTRQENPSYLHIHCCATCLLCKDLIFAKGCFSCQATSIFYLLLVSTFLSMFLQPDCLCSRTLWLFCDKTELFRRRGLCVRGHNIVFYLIFSGAGQVTSVNRELLSKPDPEQTKERTSTFQLLEIEHDNNWIAKTFWFKTDYAN